MNKFFPEIKKNFGFGFMRLPIKNSDIDYEQVSKMVDVFIKEGFNYFDTAHGYHGGLSEVAINKCLASRYDRNQYSLTNKLTSEYFNKQEDIRPFFEKQLKLCGVNYFNFYLMHAQDKNTFEKFKKCKAYETALELKNEGKIKHFGISFHDRAEVLDEILNKYPQIEVVQIQFNYLDYKSSSVDSKNVYEVCKKHNKPVLVMEPVKGGSLSNLPLDAQKIFDSLPNRKSNASYAIRYAAGFENVCVVLSGMSNLSQMEDNTSYMKEFTPLNDDEKEAVEKVCKVFDSISMIPCTSCHYCVLDNDCPKKIKIPEIFSCYNSKKLFNDWNQDYYYSNILTVDNNKASDCIKCGKCERVCPQHLEIREFLKEVARQFE